MKFSQGDYVCIKFQDGTRGPLLWVSQVRADGLVECVPPDDPYGDTQVIPSDWLDFCREAKEMPVIPTCHCKPKDLWELGHSVDCPYKPEPPCWD